jgi:hypothetical protein
MKPSNPQPVPFSIKQLSTLLLLLRIPASTQLAMVESTTTDNNLPTHLIQLSDLQSIAGVMATALIQAGNAIPTLVAQAIKKPPISQTL